MAELVQHHRESMIKEIEEMKRTKLYNEAELRYILKTRTDFEYKINGVSKSLKDFKDYIMYEKVLLKQIHNRRDKNLIAERKSGIEYKILKRIKNLYEIALHRYSNDFSLCLSYFKFCKQSNYINAASAAVQNMIKNYSHNPEVWQVAAGWYAHDRNDLSTALTVLNKGLTIHKNSQLLYTEAIKLELSVIKNSNITFEEGDEQVKKVCRKIETYVHFICDCINDCNYLIEILNLFESYKFTTPVQNLIIDKLLQNYPDKEFVWHTLAQRERRGLHHGMTAEEVQTSGKSCLTLCFEKYREGLQKVSPSEKAPLWSKYLDCLDEVQCESGEMIQSEKVALLKSALEQASNEKCLLERYYIRWLELVTDDEASSILEKGTAALPHSIDLWKLRLRYATMTDRIVKVDEVFKKGVEMLKERSLPLWFMYLRYYGLLSRDDVVANIYRDAVRQPEEISSELKPRFIEWLAITKGINDARKMYNILVNEKPYCKELHSVMCKLESAEIEHDYDAWAGVHELACRQFGEEDVDVWINHILFYLHFNKSENVNDKVQRIYAEAEIKLSPLLLSDFKEKYATAIANQ